MMPFNVDPVVTEHKELDKIRLDLGFSWPNPFGDSYCWVCDASTAWRWVKRALSPASLGYGWDTMGHNVSLEEDAETNPANPGYQDIILHDGTGSFDRWKYDSVSETYSPRYKNNYATLIKDAISGEFTIIQKDKVEMHFPALVDRKSKLATIVDRNGNTVTYTYDMDGRLSEISDGEGRSQSYVYTRVDGQPDQIVDQAGRGVTFGYDIDGRLETVTNAENEVTTMAYDGDGRVIWKEDARGQREVEFTYDPVSGKVATQTRYGEQRFSFAYNGLYRVTVTDERWDAALMQWVDPRVSVYDYNERYRLVKVVDPIGNEFRSEYTDPNNPYLLTREIDPNGFDTESTYDALGNVLTVTNAQGRVTTLTYDEGYLLKTVLRPAVEVEEVLTQYAPTTLNYDANGNLTSISDVLDSVTHTTSFVPGADGRVTSVTNRLGETTSFTYTSESLTQNKGNLASVTMPGGPDGAPVRTVTFTYDKSDNRVSAADAAGNDVAYDFDAMNRLTKVTDALGKFVDYEYLDGLLDAVEMPSLQDAGNTGLRRRTSYVRDNPGRVLQVKSQKWNGTAAVDEMRVRHEYDGRSNLKKLIRLKDTVEKPAYEFSYDALDRPVQQKNPLGDVSSIAHDPYCRNYTTTSARGKVTEVSRDSLCRVTEIANEDETRTFVYDELDRLIEVIQEHAPSGSRYGDGVSRFGGARYASTSALTESTKFLYDEWDRLKQVTYQADSVNEKTVLYEYDLEGRLIELTDVQGVVTAYTYFNDGKLKTVTVNGQVFNYSYDLAGRLEQIAYPASTGIVADFSDGTNSGWNANGQLTLLRYLKSGNLLRSFAYDYDDSGNRKSMVDTPAGGGTPVSWSYTYDWFNRLTGVAKDSIPQSVYVYDESDNRLQVEYPVSSAVHSFTYNDADRLVDRSLNGSVVETFDYDPDGNMIARVAGGVTTRYNWDSFNKLTSVSSGAVQKTYKYDAEGVRKSSDGGVRSYSSGAMSLADLRPTNSISWIQGHQLLGLVQGSDHFWYLTDGLSSVRMVVDASGNVVATTEPDEFGREVSSTGSADLRQHSYTGGVGVRNEMGELGLLYARQRWYDPGLGRWLSEDPIGFAGGLNLHGYVGGNPVNFVDPEGLEDPSSALQWPLIAFPALPALPQFLAGGTAVTGAPLILGGATIVGGSGAIILTGAGALQASWQASQAEKALQNTLQLIVVQMAKKGSRARGHSEDCSVIQTGGHIVSEGTARKLNKLVKKPRHRSEWGDALEELKGEFGLRPDHHGKIWSNGDYTDAVGNIFDKIQHYLP